MLAEHTADSGDTSTLWPKPRTWDVTSSSGFAMWKLNIEAMISSDEAVHTTTGPHATTPSMSHRHH